MRCVFVWVAALAIFGMTHVAYGANITVSPGSDSDCGDNDCDLASALALADGNGESDTITMAAGEYHAPPGGWFYVPEDENFSLTLQGAGMAVTILDGIPAGGGSAVKPLGISLLLLADDSNAPIQISGITFRNGMSTDAGGGLSIYTLSSSITVSECEFVDNIANTTSTSFGGGGLAALSVTGDITVTDSLFVGNSSPNAAGGGLGVLIPETTTSSLTVSRNVFLDNEAGTMGGTKNITGGGAFIGAIYAAATVDQNLVLGNFAENVGGGVYFLCVFDNCVFRNNIIARNTSLGVANTEGDPLPPDAVGGGGVFVVHVEGTLSMINNTLTDNTNGFSAGGLFAYVPNNGAVFNLYNNIIWGNTAGNPTFCGATSCNDILILDDFDDGEPDGTGSTVNVVSNDYDGIFFNCNPGNSCTPNGTRTPNEDDVDPLFMNAPGNDYRLSVDSPLIDMGDGSAPSLPDTDIAGSSRVIGPAPDMGAYEFDGEGSGPAECNRLVQCILPRCWEAEICQLPEFEFPGFELPGFELPEFPGADSPGGGIEAPGGGEPEMVSGDKGGGCGNDGQGEGSPASASMFFLSVPLLLGLRRWRGRNKK
jgi:hypothetical protein